MSELPTGTVTFLFTDIESSTRLWEEHPDAMQGALARHDELLRDTIESHAGYVVKTTGDGFHAAFATAADAIDAAVQVQLALVAESWSETGPLRVRIGVHTGAAEVRDGDYYGTALNRAARLMSVGHGGQVLVSSITGELVGGTVELEDLGAHHLRDLGEPVRIFQVLHPALEREFAPLRSLDAFSTNLPLQVTTFVGRDADVADVIDALGRDRVVTLIGVGGVGKTRLAVQTAAEVLPRYRDGVWLCELGPLSDPGQVPDVVADALGVQPRAGQSIAESVVTALRSKELLVVLDNCEHLLDVAAQLVDAIVGSCPGVSVLATGREGLGVRGERMMMVRSLPLPGEGATTDEIFAADAVTLFMERSTHAGGAVDLDAETAMTVAQLCRRLDGIPLAIELAAARTRMMSPQEIAARLDERFRLLTGGSRTAVERHQTLRQAVDWSYDLLDQRDRRVLDHLGVFSGGFTLDAAEAVVGGDGIDRLDVLDGVAQLVDKSLVVAERDGRDTRYRLLETIRQYALERLDERGDTDVARRSHATWCAKFMSDATDGMQGPDELTWWGRLEREIDNVRAALTWAAGADDADISLSLIGNLAYDTFFTRRIGYVLASLAALALATTGAAEDPRFAHVLAMRAYDHFNHARLNEAERDARQAIELITEGRCRFSTNPWYVLALVFFYSDRAEDIAGQAAAFLALARATGDEYTIATAASTVAFWCYVLDNPEQGVPLGEEAVQLAQTVGNPTLMAVATMWLGTLLANVDRPRARSVLDQAIELNDAVDRAWFAATCAVVRVRIGTEPVDAQLAARFRRAVAVPQEGDDAYMVLSFVDLYSQALAIGDRAEVAAVLHAAVVALAPHVSNPVSVAHRRETEERLAAQLGEERLAELNAQGAALGYDDAVALAFAELDRVIANDER